MTPKMIDLGWAMARMEENDGKPLLTICWPGGEDAAAGSVELYDTEGLVQLADVLYVFLQEWKIEQQAEIEADQDIG